MLSKVWLRQHTQTWQETAWRGAKLAMGTPRHLDYDDFDDCYCYCYCYNDDYSYHYRLYCCCYHYGTGTSGRPVSEQQQQHWR